MTGFGVRTLALTCALMAGTAAFADPVAVSPAELRLIAAQAVNTGHPDAAYAYAEALLSRDPADIDALLIGSRAARDLRRYDRAKELAQAAWRNADEDVERYAASLAMAQALSSDGKRTRAQFWLRRAGQFAPNERARLRARRDFRYVQSRNRWSTSLSFNAAPTSNVNGGSSRDTDTILYGGIPVTMSLQGAARALSGTEVSGGISTSYRLAETSDRRWTLGAGLSHTGYVLSNEAKTIAPTASGSDFANTRVSFSLGHDRILPDAGLEVGYSAGLTQVWYGGDPLTRSLTLGLRATKPQKSGTKLSFSLNHEWQQGLGGRDDARIATGQIARTSRLASGNRLTLSLGSTVSRSDTNYLDYREGRVALEYAWAKPVKGTFFSAGLSARTRYYESDRWTTGYRRDGGVSATLSATFSDFEYYGFVPTATLTAQETRSNAGLYDTNTLDLKMGIRSSF